jgi:hypothetical protein
MIAAEMTGRCFAIEIDPAYIDVAVLPWQGFTGKTVTLARTVDPSRRAPSNAAVGPPTRQGRPRDALRQTLAAFVIASQFRNTRYVPRPELHF